MRESRRLISILLTIIMLSLVILGGKGEVQFPNQADEGDEPVWTSKKETIYVWYEDPALESYLSSAAVSFGEAEGVRVIPVLKNTYNFLEEVYDATMTRDKQMPDAYVINNDELGQAYLSGLATEIQNESGMVNEAWYPLTALSAVTYNLKMVAYPFYYETSILVYNKDYLDMWVRQQADRAALAAQGVTEDEDESGDWSENCVGEDGVPLTVEGLLKFANTFDAPEGVDGVMKWDVSDIFYNYWIIGNYLNVGGECGDDSTNVDIYSDETMECLSTYQTLNQFFFIEPDNASSDICLQDFIEGRLVFTIGTTDVVRQLEEAKNEGTFLYDYGVARLPDISETLKSRTLSVTNAMAVNGFSEHKDLANRFAEYVTRTCSKELYPKAGKMATAFQASRDDRLLTIFSNQYSDSISLPKIMEIGNLWLQLEALFAKVWSGEEVLPLLRELERQISTQIGEE